MKPSLLFVLCLTAAAGCRKQAPATTVFTPPVSFTELQAGNGATATSDFMFLDPSNGVLCGTSYMASTVDGGSNWSLLDVGSNQGFQSTFLLTPNEFYVARNGLFRTTDAGAHFEEICALSGIHDTWFFDHDHGLIAAAGSIYSTPDAGESWEPVYQNETGLIMRIEFVSALTGYGWGGTTSDGYSGGQIVRTTDGGKTWSQVYVSTVSEPISVSFPTEKIGYFTNTNGELYKTMNGGFSWAPAGNFPEPYSYIWFVTGTAGYRSSLATGQLFLTRDSGAHWELVYTCQSSERVIKMQRVGNTVYGLTTDGVLLRSN